ncbi:flagellar filament capping protein FliD [Myxococcota bacterium]|nr:flagellar filament capping protein FliD [Myxococcota bacterium]
MASIMSPGIGSNLDVNGIVEQLMAVERRKLTALDSKEAGYQVKISAFGSLKSALSSVQSEVKKLADPKKFTNSVAMVGDATMIAANAFGRAPAGTYDVEVTHLAAAQKLKSGGYESSAASVGTGTLHIQLGTYDSGSNQFAANDDFAELTVAIDAAHSTLAGVRDAINAANGDVTASIVNDGGPNGTRLVVSSKHTGTERSVKITVEDDDGTDTNGSGLSALAFDPTAGVGAGKNLVQTVAAEDAQVIIDGITVNSQKNTITDALEGVTLNLLKAEVGKSTTITVERDSGGARAAITSFVKTYNDFAKAVSGMTAYNAETKVGGTLVGDAAARSLERQLRSVLTTAGVGSTGTYKLLAEVGVTFGRDGTLAVDTAKLDAALAEDVDSVASLFSVQGLTDDPEVTFVSSTGVTAAGSYAVDVTRLATQGTTTGVQASTLSIVQGVNDTLDVEVDGQVVSITLAARNYASADELAEELETKVNTHATLNERGLTVTVSQTAGVLSLTSGTWGSESKVRVVAGTGLTDVGFAAATETTGVDVAGTIDGIPAEGEGRYLSAAAGSAAEGLKIEITGSRLGSRGDVDFSRGISDRLDKLIDRLNGTGGIVASKTDGYDASVKQIDKRREEVARQLEKVEARYRAQFAALDKIVSQLKSTSNYLTQQLDKLPGFGSQE